MSMNVSLAKTTVTRTPLVPTQMVDSLVLVTMDSAVTVHPVPISMNVMAQTLAPQTHPASILKVDMTANVTQAMLETVKSVMTLTNAALHHAQPTHHAQIMMDHTHAHAARVSPVTVNTVSITMSVIIILAENENAQTPLAVSVVVAL